MQVERAARALGASVKTYERDLLIAGHPWMFQHVIDDSVAPTPAFKLLAQAKEVGRLAELKEDLDATGTNRDHYVVNIHVEDHQDFIAAMYQEAEDLGDD